MVDDFDELLDIREACAAIGGRRAPIAASTLYRGIKAGRFPKPIKVGPATSRWRKSALLEAIQRLAETQ